jgi:hypothetical protein
VEGRSRPEGNQNSSGGKLADVGNLSRSFRRVHEARQHCDRVFSLFFFGNLDRWDGYSTDLAALVRKVGAENVRRDLHRFVGPLPMTMSVTQ